MERSKNEARLSTVVDSQSGQVQQQEHLAASAPLPNHLSGSAIMESAVQKKEPDPQCHSQTAKTDGSPESRNDHGMSRSKHSPTDRPTRSNPKRKARTMSSRIDYLTEWRFPEETRNRWEFVMAALKKGADAESVGSHLKSACTPRTTTSPKRKRRRITEESTRQRKKKSNSKGTKPVNSKHAEGGGHWKTRIQKACGVAYDSRFLDYPVAQDGSKKEDRLIWCGRGKEPGDCSIVESAYMLEVPDIPKRPTKTASRVGPLYQAKVPKWKASHNNIADPFKAPSYELSWDPKRAEEAERNGEDITGYLEGEKELCRKELLMKILHSNNYDVKLSQADYNREIHNRGDWHHEFQTDEQEDDYCLECDDGGDLLVCDSCRRGAHLECLKPKLKEMPKGDWFCPICVDHFHHTVNAPGISTRNEKASIHSQTFNLKPREK